MVRGRSRAAIEIETPMLAAAALLSSAAPADAGLVTTVWDCTNGDVLTFALPAAAVSPGAGATVAPFPGFLTAVNSVGADQPTPALGTYVVLGIVTADGTVKVGKKSGLSAGGLTCTLEGAEITVVIAPAAH